MNQVTLCGRIGQAPELKHTPSGAAVCEFSVATTKIWYNDQREKQEKTEWHRITAWRGRAETIAKHFNKGDQIMLTGELYYDKWEKEGQKHTSAKINVNDFDFGQKRRSQATEPPPNNAYSEAGGQDLSNVMGGTPEAKPADEAPAF